MQHIEFALARATSSPCGAWPGRSAAAPPIRCTGSAPPCRPTRRSRAASRAHRRRRRQHADHVAAVMHHLGQLQHVGLHAAGHVERIRADHADAHQVASSLARRSSDRSASHCGCIMCQSAGCAAMLRANRSANAWVTAVTSLETGVERCLEIDDPVVAVVLDVRRNQMGARWRWPASPDPAGNRVGSPKKSTSTPVRVRSRSAIRQTSLLSRSRSASTSNGGRSPPVSGKHLEAQAFPVVDEPAVQRFGLEPLGDGGEGAVLLGEPHAGHVPVAAVRQRQDRRRGRRPLPPATVLRCSHRRAGVPSFGQIHRGQPERLPPVSGVGGKRSTNQPVRHAVGWDAEHAGKVLA